MLLTFSCLALWPRERGPWRGALIPGLLAGAAFMTRTTGLALLPAGAAAFLFRREWKRAATFTTAFILVNLPLILRTMSIEGTPLGYTKYSAEGGLMDKLHTLAVFIPHYLFYGLPDLMFYRLISQDGLLAKLHLGSLAGPAGIAIGLLIAIGFFSRAFRFGVTELYWAAYFLIISSFNQPDYAARGEYLFQDRYVIPVIPIAAWYLVRALIMLGGKRESGLRRTASRVTVLLLSCYVTATAAGAGIFRFKSESVHRGRHPMDSARYADLPNDNDRAWGRYFGCSFWLASNAPSGSVIISRKPYEAFLASGHSSTRYLELGTGTNLLNRIRPWEERGNFIIEDSFTPDTAIGLERIAIIEPLISEHADKFTLVYETQGREARVWRVR